jgi:hypothetical protein
LLRTMRGALRALLRERWFFGLPIYKYLLIYLS